MSTKTDVPIPADRIPVVMGEECVAWLVKQATGGIQGYIKEDGYVLCFDEADEARRFGSAGYEE